jgi:hypothetical protein
MVIRSIFINIKNFCGLSGRRRERDIRSYAAMAAEGFSMAPEGLLLPREYCVDVGRLMLYPCESRHDEDEW